MKGILIILSFLFSVKAVACDCDSPGIIEKYLDSEFIASAIVTKVYPNVGEEEIYKADIQIEELFKGQKLNSIYVYGRSDGKMGSSCSIFIPEKTKLIIYAHKNKNGQYGIGMCFGLLYLNKNNDSRQIDKQEKELEILRILKANKTATRENISFWHKELITRDLHDALQQFNGVEFDKSFGIYEMSFNPDLSLNSVKVISGFNDSIDSKLIEILQNSEWSRQIDVAKDKFPENRKLLIGIYYYKAERGNQSFLSQYYL